MHLQDLISIAIEMHIGRHVLMIGVAQGDTVSFAASISSPGPH